MAFHAHSAARSQVSHRLRAAGERHTATSTPAIASHHASAIGQSAWLYSAKIPKNCSDVNGNATRHPPSGRPYRKYIAGTTTMLSSVDVISPHRMTMAIGV